MNIREEVLDRLRSGESVAQVRAGYRSSSEVCEGVRLYLDELKKRTDDARSSLGAVEKKRVLEEAEVKRLRLEKNDLGKDVQDLRATEEELQGNIDGAIEELKHVSSGFEEYTGQGFDKELFLKLRRLGGKTGEEVWRALEDAREAQRLREEVVANAKKLEEANDAIALVKGRHRKLERNIESMEKKLRGVKVQLTVYQEIFDVVDLAVKNGIKKKEVCDLLERLMVGKGLLAVRREIRLAEVRLGELLRREIEAKARAEAIGDAYLKAIENMRIEGAKAIFGVASKAGTEVQNLVDGFGKDLARRNAVVEDVALLQQRKEQLQSYIGPAQVLIGVLESPDALRLVPVPLVAQLLDRLSLWGEVRFPDDRLCVFFDFFSGELNVASTGNCLVKISSLVRVTTEALRRQLAQLNREQQAS